MVVYAFLIPMLSSHLSDIQGQRLAVTADFAAGQARADQAIAASLARSLVAAK